MQELQAALKQLQDSSSSSTSSSSAAMPGGACDASATASAIATAKDNDEAGVVSSTSTDATAVAAAVAGCGTGVSVSPGAAALGHTLEGAGLGEVLVEALVGLPGRLQRMSKVEWVVHGVQLVVSVASVAGYCMWESSHFQHIACQS